MCPHDNTTSSTPWERSQSSIKAMKGRSTSGTTGFGTVLVSGRSRVPSPPARMSACIRDGRGLDGDAVEGAADALVGQAGVAHGLRVEEVAPVDEHVAAHARGNLAEVEVGELRPLRDEHDGVGALDRLQGGPGELHVLDELARLLLGH